MKIFGCPASSHTCTLKDAGPEWTQTVFKQQKCLRLFYFFCLRKKVLSCRQTWRGGTKKRLCYLYKQWKRIKTTTIRNGGKWLSDWLDESLCSCQYLHLWFLPIYGLRGLNDGHSLYGRAWMQTHLQSTRLFSAWEENIRRPVGVRIHDTASHLLVTLELQEVKVEEVQQVLLCLTGP